MTIHSDRRRRIEIRPLLSSARSRVQFFITHTRMMTWERRSSLTREVAPQLRKRDLGRLRFPWLREFPFYHFHDRNQPSFCPAPPPPPSRRRLQFQAVRIWIVYHYVHRSRLLRLRRRFRAAANEELLLSFLRMRGPPLTEDKSSMGSPPLWPSSPLLDTLPFFLSRRRSTVIGIQ